MVKEILKVLNLTVSDLARFTGISTLTVYKWINGKAKPKGTSEQTINALYLIVKRIQRLKGKKMKKWAVDVLSSSIKTMTVGECVRRAMPTYVITGAEAGWKSEQEKK